ncbi:MAG: hypothetical protein NTV82_01180, partial [Candidatus Aminicenantes bacterium]|nr:hypothetical protein [Candidatus Aminicenantes bacterium]
MCKIYKILYAAIPVKKWKSTLIRRHFERCPRCAEEIIFMDHVVRAFFKPDWIQEAPDQWPQIRPRIFSHEVQLQRFRPEISPPRVQARRWSLAAATTAFLILGTIGFFILRQYKTPGPESFLPKDLIAAVPRVQVISAELGGKRAKAYIY